MSSDNKTKATKAGLRAALPKNAKYRLCCVLNPLNKCKLCNVSFCYECWMDDDLEWLHEVTSFKGNQGSSEQVCNVCTEKWFVKNFYKKI